jgi:ABC-type antimicrobial peptide transport system permease subunit
LGFGAQAGSVAVLMIVSLASAWLSARKASRVHPADALRAESEAKAVRA